MTQMRDLLQKYDVQGPRYTSYPTVPYWETTPSESQWLDLLRAEIKSSQARKSGAALYIHLPFCESLCTFCACNRIITKKHDRADSYIDTVLAEWALYRKHLGFDKLDVSEIHLGGGTPTFLSPTQLERLLTPLLAQIHLLPHAELSFETDPRVTTQAHLEMMAKLGFTRISLGIQDYDPVVQKAINREQSPDYVGALCAATRAQGMSAINFDLVYGLPHQTLNSIRNTIAHVVAQRPDRIAFYAYAHVPWVGQTGQRGFEDSDLPKADEKRALYEVGRSLLEAAGYVEVGMDHFALPHDALFQAVARNTLYRNFMGYVPHHVSPMIGLGVSSISDSWTCFMQNEKSLSEYEARIKNGELPIHRGHVLTDEDLAVRRVILDLMTQFTALLAPLASVVDINTLRARLAEAANDDLVHFGTDQIVVHKNGKPFIRNICMAFDVRMQRKMPDTQIFSRTI